MKLIEKVHAYRALTEMMKADWEFSFIYPLVCLMQELKADYEFFCREEMKLAARFGKKDEDGLVTIDETGYFRFSDEESREEYQRRHLDLEETEAAECSRRVLPMPRSVRGEWLKALLPCCDFRQEDAADGTIA